MATYQEIQKWVWQHHRFVPKSGWIAHCKELYGVPISRRTFNRKYDQRRNRCPAEKQLAIKEAFRHFKMLP